MTDFKAFILSCGIILLCSCSAIYSQGIDSDNNPPETKLFWPPSPQTPRIQFIKSIHEPRDVGIKRSTFQNVVDSIFGKEESQGGLLNPYGIFATNRRIYVTDTGTHSLHVFDLNDNTYLQIREVNGLPLQSPIGVAEDVNGEIYLTDSMLRRVFIFSASGKYLRDLGDDNSFQRPTGIAIDNEKIFVTDTLAHTVRVYSKKTGRLLFSFGSRGLAKGEFNYPTHIFVGRNDGLVYVTDSMNFRIQTFTKDGRVLHSFGKAGDGSGDFSKPKGVAVDSENHIYIVDSQFDNVQIFNTEGNLLLTFGKTGRKTGEMLLPSGIFIDNRDRIYVADSYNNRVQIFQYLKDVK